MTISARVERADDRPRSGQGGVPWLLLANISYSLSLWLVVVIASRAGAVILGQYALAMAIVSPLHLLLRGNLRELYSTDASGDFGLAQYRRLRLLASGAFLLTCLAAAAIVGYEPPVRLSIVVLAVAKTIDMWSDLAYGVFQRRHDLKAVATSFLLRGGLAVAFAGTGLLLLRSAVGLAAGLGLAWTVVLLFHDRPRMAQAERGREEPRGPVGLPWALVHAAWPLGVVAMLLSLMHNLPRYFIERELGLAAVGVYAGISYILVAAAGVGAAIGQARAATFGSLWARGLRRPIARSTWRAIAVVAVGGLAAALVAIPFGGRILALLYGPEFDAYGPELVAVCLAAIPAAALPVVGAAMTASHRRTAQAVCLGLGTLAVAASATPLISRFAMMGAVLSLALGFALALLGQLGVLRAASGTTPSGVQASP